MKKINFGIKIKIIKNLKQAIYFLFILILSSLTCSLVLYP